MPPELPDVVPGEPVESDWGNDVRDRIVQRFADDSARNASLPFPQAGAVTWLDDPGVVEVFDGTDWITLHQNGNPIDLGGGDLTGAGDVVAAVVQLIADGYGTDVDNASQTGRNILVGTDVPDNAWGKDGDVFIRLQT